MVATALAGNRAVDRRVQLVIPAMLFPLGFVFLIR